MTEREKRPRRDRGWTEIPFPREARTENTLVGSAWSLRSVRVISELCNAELPGVGVGPTWHVSVTRLARRPMLRDVEHALRDFDLVGAEEDNHHPGSARHFFLPVDPAHRGLCECKTTEDVVIEPDGYTWSNPKEFAREACRGCDLERMQGKPCPIHTVRRLVEEEL